ncbi:hypothetical protein [Methylocaldum sp.]|jgi:hypothetical protein|uniref:hypothetical protein n=1 Tax=Methylocaldum sp. TaxID=1969727 RepID=UPI00321F9627
MSAIADKDRRSKDRQELLSFRVSKAIHSKIKELAERECRPMSYQCEKFILEALEHRGERIKEGA